MPSISKAEAMKMGIPSHTLQTVLIPKSWGVERAKRWLADGHFVNSYWRETANYLRFMNVNPIRGAKYSAKKLKNGVIMVNQTY
jgi:hypothetical protein